MITVVLQICKYDNLYCQKFNQWFFREGGVTKRSWRGEITLS